MTILEISQIIFNVVISLAVVLIAILVSIIAIGIIKFSRSCKNFIDGINKESSELYEKVNNFLDSFSKLSFISKLFKSKKNN